MDHDYQDHSSFETEQNEIPRMGRDKNTTKNLFLKSMTWLLAAAHKGA